MLFLAPAVGVPHEEMLQDTLKSAVVAFGVLSAALWFLVRQRTSHAPLHWHGLLWLPLALCGYALGSMAWSHAYLAGVEAVRWFLFALLAWLALHACTPRRLPWLALAVHGGALVASLWTVLQFWVDFGWFPQGPQPASTFINRNFFAEYAVCTLPLGFWLATRCRRPACVLALAATSAVVTTALLMTGTRSALVALWLLLLLVLPLIAWRARDALAWPQWPRALRLGAPLLFLALVLALGSLPSGNPQILQEGRGATALERGLLRTQSIGPTDASLGIRMAMWRATARLVADRPLSGVGAGAWENAIPLYQGEGAQRETDYYAHNEFLQLVAEYGLAGWAFLLPLFGYLCVAGWRCWRAATPAEAQEAPLRATLLACLLALMVVSLIGFPWRLASTGALFALALGALAASDVRLAAAGARWTHARALPWAPAAARSGLLLGAAGLVLAAFITQRAVESERHIVQAVKLALAITASGSPHHARWQPARQEMLRLVREGIALNPHYRKLTPMVADELARWGDWRQATWIWESVLASRPHIVAILGNVARGYSTLGQPQRAREYLARAQAIQPRAPAVQSLEVVLLAREGREAQALRLARRAVDSGDADFDMVNTLFVLARRAGEPALAQRALELRIARWPETAARGYVQLGLLQAQVLGDPGRALEAFRRGLALADPREQALLWPQVPEAYRERLRAGATHAPPAALPR